MVELVDGRLANGAFPAAIQLSVISQANKATDRKPTGTVRGLPRAVLQVNPIVMDATFESQSHFVQPWSLSEVLTERCSSHKLSFVWMS